MLLSLNSTSFSFLSPYRMATKMKDKMVATAQMFSTTSDSDSEHVDLTPAELKDEKYLLRVSAGPSYDESTQLPVLVNGHFATPFENEFMKGNIKVRIRDYKGLPLYSPQSSAYFEHPSRSKEQYSISFSFVPKIDINAADTLWGNDFDHPVRDRLPPGFSVAVKIVKEFVDPTIELDAYADKPWMYAPAMASFFAFSVGEKKSLEEWSKGGIPFMPGDEPLEEGASGNGAEVREALKFPEDRSARRKFCRSKDNLKDMKFEAGRLYQADFFNPYIDFGSFSLKLPGLSINCIKYINDKTHKLRYVFRNSKTGDLYFCVILTLLFGDDLQEALNDDAARWEKAQAAVDGSPPVELKNDEVNGNGDKTSSTLTEKPTPEVERAYVLGKFVA
jgi:uncharacterized protein DUF1769